MITVGLTGGIGSGKTEVARLLAAHGALVIDADAVAREVVAPGTPGLARVVAEFGPGVLALDGGLDRAKLAALVFADPAARERLNGIVHPLVAARSTELAGAAPVGSVVVHDVPLLVEGNLAAAYDLVLVVQAPPEARIRRLRDSRRMSEEEIRARMAAQASDEQRRAVADVVIDNGGDLAELATEVDRVWRERIAAQGLTN